MPRAYIGCSGWNYAHWRDVLYPRGLPASRWLEHYARHFDTVEVNATFYRLPTRKAAASWVEAALTEFVFAIEASRYLTHVEGLRQIGNGVARLLERIEPLVAAGRLGPILWQLESFHRDDVRLAEALASLPPGRHAFELRHASWFVPDVERLLHAHGAALVIGNHPGRPLQTRTRTAEWAYIRFHHGRARDGGYTPSQLEAWAELVRAWQGEGDVYAYFDDEWAGHAVREAKRLRELVE